MTAKRLNLAISLNIEETETGKPFNNVNIEWFDLPYADLVEMQGQLLNVLKEFHAWGVARVAAENNAT